MKYFKDAQGVVYAYESDGSQDAYIQPGLIAISESDALAITSPPSSAAEMITTAQDRISTAYQAAVDALTAGYPQDEIASWPKQETEARAWLADNTVSTPWVDAAAASRGIAKADFVTLIIGNADALAPLHGALTGKRQKLRDEITALGSTPTQAQLDAIQW